MLMNLTWENNEKPNFASFLAQIWSLKNFFVTFTSTRHYDKVTLHAIFRKIYDAKTQENGGKPYFGSNLGPLDQDLGRQFFFKNLAPSITGSHGHLSSSTISEKTNDPILRKLDRRTGRREWFHRTLYKQNTTCTRKNGCKVKMFWRPKIFDTLTLCLVLSLSKG